MNLRGITGGESFDIPPNPFQAAPQVESESSVLSVTDALALANKSLKGLTLTVEGEVTSFKDSSGYSAIYFTLQDEASKLDCRIWTNRYRSLGVELKNQLKVQVTGNLDIYAKTGRLSFDVHKIVVAGEGLLRQQVHELANRLRAEGYMDPAKKLPIPKLPEVVGIVTSGQGSVVHDMLRTLRARLPLARIVFASVPVEGDKAVPAIMKGMRAVYDAGAEVILLGRGGGSLQDLMPFNNESLAKTISRCPIPVVVAVGHETDTTIAEMVSDLRASTPTAAAAAISPDPGALQEQLAQYGQRLNRSMQLKLAALEARVASIATRPIFSDAMLLFEREAQTLDYLREKLERALPSLVAENAYKLDTYKRQLRQALPVLVLPYVSSIGHLETRLTQATGNLLPSATEAVAASHVALSAAIRDSLAREQMQLDGYAQLCSRDIAVILDRQKQALAVAAANLEALSPLAVLSRGYAFAKASDGKVVRSIHQVEPMQRLDLRVSDGIIECHVDNTLPLS